MQKIKLGLVALMFSLATVTGLVGSAPVYAATPKADACAALQQLDSTRTCDGKDTGINSLIKATVNILSYVVGIAAVIMIIISGLKYVTASGDPSNVTSAKNTLLYAMVGLFIAALAQFLVRFVLSTANK